MATILLGRHSGTEKPRYVLYNFFSGIEQVVREGGHEVVAMPIFGPWPRKEVEAWLLEHGLLADLFLSTEPAPVQMLREHGWQGKVIYMVTGGPVTWTTRLRQVLPYLRPQDLIWCSTAADRVMYESLVEQNAASPDVVDLPYGVDTGTFSPCWEEARRQLREAHGIAPDEFVLLHVTVRLTMDKNLPALLEVLHALVRSGRKARLIIAGEFANVPFYEFNLHMTGLSAKLTAMAGELGLSDRVQLIDWPDNVRRNELYNLADAFVNLSLPHEEAFPFTQVEAFSSGLPSVMAAWGHLQLAGVHGESGFLVDTWLSDHGVRVDLPGAVRAVTALMDDPALRQRMQRQARQFAEEVHGWAGYREQVLGLIDRVLGRPATSCQPRLTAFGERYHARFSRTSAAGTDVLQPVYSGFADPDYRALMAPYVSRTAHGGDRVFAALPGKCSGDYFYSGDLLWPGRIRITSAEAEVMRQLSRTHTVPVETLGLPPEQLLALAQKGLVGFSRA